VAWNTALLRPDRVRAVAGFCVPFRPRAGVPPTVAMRHAFGDKFYQLYFQQPGVAEREFSTELRGGLRRVLHAASGSAPPEQRWQPIVRAGFLADLVDPGAAPAWFGEDALDALTAAFTRSGFRGGLAWYRNMDRSWELSAAFAGLTIRQPALFIAGDADPGYPAARPAIDALAQVVPGLRRTLILPGCGHWVGEERPDEVNAALLEFLAGL
jgi:pimeloyl-ACP methyl ester carboxylesterase